MRAKMSHHAIDAKAFLSYKDKRNRGINQTKQTEERKSKNMKRLTIIAAAVALIAMGRSAEATIIIGPTTVSYSDEIGGGAPDLDITYEVTESAADLYTYCYTLVAADDANLTSFVIGGGFDPIDTDTMVITETGGASSSSIVPDYSVSWQWSGLAGVDDTTVAFTSEIGPGYFEDSILDDGALWAAPPLIPAPAPVPEASTIMAGALMILPLGIGAFRAVRKERMA
jgi:hypothetical protein